MQVKKVKDFQNPHIIIIQVAMRKKRKKIVPMVSPMLIKHQLIIFYCFTWDPIYPSFLDKIGLQRIMYNILQGDWVEKPK
jgi:hypothetical protein